MVTASLYTYAFDLLKIIRSSHKVKALWEGHKIWGGKNLPLVLMFTYVKANVRKKVLFSRTDFLPWEILFIKKLELEKTKPT